MATLSTSANYTSGWSYPGLVVALGLSKIPWQVFLEMGKTRAPYPAEFKKEAARLARSGGNPVVQIARGVVRELAAAVCR